MWNQSEHNMNLVNSHLIQMSVHILFTLTSYFSRNLVFWSMRTLLLLKLWVDPFLRRATTPVFDEAPIVGRGAVNGGGL